MLILAFIYRSVCSLVGKNFYLELCLNYRTKNKAIADTNCLLSNVIEWRACSATCSTNPRACKSTRRRCRTRCYCRSTSYTRRLCFFSLSLSLPRVPLCRRPGMMMMNFFFLYFLLGKCMHAISHRNQTHTHIHAPAKTFQPLPSYLFSTYFTLI